MFQSSVVMLIENLLKVITITIFILFMKFLFVFSIEITE